MWTCRMQEYGCDEINSTTLPRPRLFVSSPFSSTFEVFDEACLKQYDTVHAA